MDLVQKEVKKHRQESKVILDCNIIISAGLTDGACRQVVLKALKQYQIVVTDAILLEYRSVAQRKKFLKVKDIMLEMK